MNLDKGEQSEGTGTRDQARLRRRLHTVHEVVEEVRREPWRPFQVHLSAFIAGSIPLGWACGLVRLAITHDVPGFLIALGLGGAITAAAIAWCVRSHPDEPELHNFFRVELLALGFVVLMVALFRLER